VHIEFLVEEASMEAALVNLLPSIFSDAATFSIHPHQGKSDLLAQLPLRLRGYRRWLPDDWRIVVLMDTDGRDCRQVKADLEQLAQEAGFATKSAVPPDQPFQVVNRLAVEELEAWLLGDVEALRTAYPRVSPTLANKARYRDPDAIGGGTWEALERLLQRKGYHKEGLPKIRVARDVSEHMEPARNRSRSFQVFCSGLLALVEQQ
jgi:hypothetical protein